MSRLLVALALLGSAFGFQSSTERYLSQVSHQINDHVLHEDGNPPIHYNNVAYDQQVSARPTNNAAWSSAGQSRDKSISVVMSSDEVYEMPSSALVTNNNELNIESLAVMSKDALVDTLVKYQTFMRQYMITAQEQKYRAVRAAEEAADKKWKEAITTLDSIPVMQPSASISSSLSSQPQSPLYAARNAAVSKAGAAGKSRWGDVEVKRVAAASSSGLAPSLPGAVNGARDSSSSWTVSSPPTTNTMRSGPVPVPVAVAEADHGLRADGGVGGWSLAERVHFGSSVKEIPLTTPSSSSSSSFSSASSGPSISSTNLSPLEVLYTRRNLRVVQAAQARKSRWGAQEVDRVASIVAAMPPAVLESARTQSEASSKQRINLGASIVSKL